MDESKIKEEQQDEINTATLEEPSVESTEGFLSADSENIDSFDHIKQKASTNLSQLLEDLQAFEKAVRDENIPEIYQLYNGHLNDELKRSSNENHEIDQLLMRKIHDRFLQEFPFMKLVENVTPTINYYQIGTYYHERPTIGIDASSPEIFVLPSIDEEWQKYAEVETKDYDHQINELEAKVITAQTEIDRIDAEIDGLMQQITELANNRGFLNRKKMDEEIEDLEKQKQLLENEKTGWQPYLEEPEKIQEQKEALRAEARADQLRAAIVEKERRQINRYFGSMEGFSQTIHHFLMDYLGNEQPEFVEEGSTEDEPS